MSNLKDLKVVITGAWVWNGSSEASGKRRMQSNFRRKKRRSFKELCSELGDSAAYSVTDVKEKKIWIHWLKLIDTFGGVDATSIMPALCLYP